MNAILLILYIYTPLNKTHQTNVENEASSLIIRIKSQFDNYMFFYNYFTMKEASHYSLRKVNNVWFDKILCLRHDDLTFDCCLSQYLNNQIRVLFYCERGH